MKTKTHGLGPAFPAGAQQKLAAIAADHARNPLRKTQAEVVVERETAGARVGGTQGQVSRAESE